jgi:hypothetical protein
VGGGVVYLFVLALPELVGRRLVDNIYNPLAVFEFKEMAYIAVYSKEKMRLVVIGVSLIVENSIKEI